MENNRITMLKGPDRVRLRPSVFFGSDGIEGVLQSIKAIFDIVSTEAVMGYCEKINVRIHKDNSVSIHSWDRGLLIDETMYDGFPEWHYDFCELYGKPHKTDDYVFLSSFTRCTHLYDKQEKTLPKYPLDEEYHLEISFTQCVSEFMNVISIRDGIKKTLSFRKGHSVLDLKKEASNDESSTYIHFKPDHDVFTDTNLPINRIRNMIRGRAVCISGIEFNLCDERSEINETYYYPEGIEGYAKALTVPEIPLFVKEIETTGRDRYNRKDYDARVKIYFGFSSENAQVGCFHNYRVLQNGGSHLDEVKEKIANNINWEFNENFLRGTFLSPEDIYEARRKADFSFDELEGHIILILESNCSDGASCWMYPTRTAITNRMITDMANDLIGKEFDEYLSCNHKEILSILKEIDATRPKN